MNGQLWLRVCALLGLVVTLLFAPVQGPVHAQDAAPAATPAETPAPPPAGEPKGISPWATTWMAIGGLATQVVSQGVVTLVAVAVVISSADTVDGESFVAAGVGGAVTLFVGNTVVATAATAGTIYGIGSAYDYEGSYLFTWLGTFVGAAVGTGITFAVAEADATNTGAIAAMYWLVTPLLATAGGIMAYYFTRDLDAERAQASAIPTGALVSLTDDGWSVDPPSLMVGPADQQQGGLLLFVPMLGGRW